MTHTSRWFLFFLIIAGVGVGSKPIDDLAFDPEVNEVNTGTQRDQRKSVGVEVVANEATGRSLDAQTTTAPRILSAVVRTEFSSGSKDTDKSNISTNDEITKTKTKTKTTTTTKKQDVDQSTKQQNFPWILSPFGQKIQFSPETFVQDRIGQLKNTLANLGSIFPNQKDAEGKQLPIAAGGLANLVGLNDSGFYTNRFDPAGFFGGNGWFANKGGLLGGPGALISTGSLFTDYQTAYRK